MSSQPESSFPLFLINRTDAIGDTLLTTPLGRFLKDRFPESRVHFIVSPRSGELLGLCEGVDHYHVYDPSWGFFTKWKFLRDLMKSQNFTHFFHVGGDFLPMMAAFITGIRFRGGLRSKLPSFFFLNKGMRQSRRLVTMHESDYNLELARELGGETNGKRPDQYRPLLKISSSQKEEALRDISFRANSGKRLIIIHPGMSGHTLNWASRNYGRLVLRMAQQSPGRFHFVISHTPSDEPYLEGLRDFLSQNPIGDEAELTYFNGAEKGILHYAGLLSGADLFIGPSTGTSHMANALSIPQLALFSPIRVQSSKRWGPYTRNESVKVIVPDVVCGESTQCAGSICPYYECMAKIEVEEVTQAALEILERKEKREAH